MAEKSVLVGSAAAVRAAVSVISSRVEIAGAVLLDAGDVAIPVLASGRSLDDVNFEKLPARTVVLCAKPAPDEARELLARAAECGAKLNVVEAGAVRDLTLSDLIGAADRNSNVERLRARIGGKRVLITGGGGSIGGALARKIAALGPAQLVLLDSSECNLFQISHDLPSATLALADVRDGASVRRWFDKVNPEIVFHTAALKQVPMVEAFPGEGVLTNICGLRNVAEAAQAIGATTIFVSTDKAADPNGAMGATKRFGELLCQAMDRRGGARIVPVRLGNVLGSAGSVSPLFEAQAAARRPLTVTDPEVTRFFLSIPQAADALLRAADSVLAGDAPLGTVLVIDMGEPLPVVELARAVIRLAGLRPDVDLPIVITGLRPGEKLHEQLISASETIVSDAGAGVTAVTSAGHSLLDINTLMDRLEQLARAGADAIVASELFAAVRPAARAAAMAAD